MRVGYRHLIVCDDIHIIVVCPARALLGPVVVPLSRRMNSIDSHLMHRPCIFIVEHGGVPVVEVPGDVPTFDRSVGELELFRENRVLVAALSAVTHSESVVIIQEAVRIVQRPYRP